MTVKMYAIVAAVSGAVCLAAGLAIDAALHLALFWGMREGQIYCGHWFYVLPIFWAGAVAPAESLRAFPAYTAKKPSGGD